MPDLVEGYTTADTSDSSFQSDQVSQLAAWLGPLREDARAALVRRMVMERIQTGGYEGFSEAQKYEIEWARIIEAFVLGTAIAITSQLVFKWMNKKFKGAKK